MTSNYRLELRHRAALDRTQKGWERTLGVTARGDVEELDYISARFEPPRGFFFFQPLQRAAMMRIIRRPGH